jgi:ATP-dependent DNA ligase
MMVRRAAGRIQVLTRNGHDWTARFPLMVAAAEAIKAKNFLIDGEAVVCDESGMPMFDRMRYRRNDANVFLYAFDLLSLNP